MKKIKMEGFFLVFSKFFFSKKFFLKKFFFWKRKNWKKNWKKIYHQDIVSSLFSPPRYSIFSGDHGLLVFWVFFFGRPIENRWPMFLSPLVCLLVGWSHEVAKMSNNFLAATCSYVIPTFRPSVHPFVSESVSEFVSLLCRNVPKNLL